MLRCKQLLRRGFVWDSSWCSRDYAPFRRQLYLSPKTEIPRDVFTSHAMRGTASVTISVSAPPPWTNQPDHRKSVTLAHKKTHYHPSLKTFSSFSVWWRACVLSKQLLRLLGQQVWYSVLRPPDTEGQQVHGTRQVKCRLRPVDIHTFTNSPSGDKWARRQHSHGQAVVQKTTTHTYQVQRRNNGA